MADKVRNMLSNKGSKKAYVYVSHEHKDHFDVEFLQSIETFEFKYVIPHFRRSILFDTIRSFTKHEIILCEDDQKVPLNSNEYLKLYLDDSELNRDSAILYSNNTFKFLNLNDCKIHDRLRLIKKTVGEIDLFTVQFSGATWHPTCYEYTEAKYERISRKKKLSKFESTALAIENLDPKAYVPSAGPACFLDPDIIHINFQKENIFPRNNQIVNYLKKRLKKNVDIFDMMPGDHLNINNSINFNHTDLQRVSNQNLREYITNYAHDYDILFKKLKSPVEHSEFPVLLKWLIDEFGEKLKNFKSRAQIQRPLYIGFMDQAAQFIEINFQESTIKVIPYMLTDNFYLIKVNSYDIRRVRDGLLTWEDFSLTFRMRLNRSPDVYQVLMQGFLILEKEDLNFFCDKIVEIENRSERIVVEVGGIRYSIDRYCPHQGADLTDAWSEDNRFLVCPRHRWAFDMENKGKCENNLGCINGIALESD